MLKPFTSNLCLQPCSSALLLSLGLHPWSSASMSACLPTSDRGSGKGRSCRHLVSTASDSCGFPSRIPRAWLILSSIEQPFILGELLPSVSSQMPVMSSVAIGTFFAVVVIAVLQSGQSSDDDDSGPGDGGLMQPVGLNA